MEDETWYNPLTASDHLFSITLFERSVCEGMVLNGNNKQSKGEWK